MPSNYSRSVAIPVESAVELRDILPAEFPRRCRELILQNSFAQSGSVVLYVGDSTVTNLNCGLELPPGAVQRYSGDSNDMLISGIYLYAKGAEGESAAILNVQAILS